MNKKLSKAPSIRLISPFKSPRSSLLPVLYLFPAVFFPLLAITFLHSFFFFFFMVDHPIIQKLLLSFHSLSLSHCNHCAQFLCQIVTIPRGKCQSPKTKLSIAQVMVRIQMYHNYSKAMGARFVLCNQRTENKINIYIYPNKRKDCLCMVNLSTSVQDKYPVVRLMAHFTEISSVHLSTMMAILSKT